MLARFLQGAAKRGQLQYVGGNGGTWAGATSGNNTVSLTALTGGIASSAQSGDLVVAAYAVGTNSSRTLAITDGTNNYTLIGSQIYANTTYDTVLRVAYKRLTGADASVTFGPTGTSGHGGAAVVHVWRGVNAATPLDVAAVPASGTGTFTPRQVNPASITPATSGAKILVVGSVAAATAPNLSASYLSGVTARLRADSVDSSILIGYVDWTSGAYDPALLTGTFTASDAWAAMTIALRPA